MGIYSRKGVFFDKFRLKYHNVKSIPKPYYHWIRINLRTLIIVHNCCHFCLHIILCGLCGSNIKTPFRCSWSWAAYLIFRIGNILLLLLVVDAIFVLVYVCRWENNFLICMQMQKRMSYT